MDTLPFLLTVAWLTFLGLCVCSANSGKQRISPKPRSTSPNRHVSKKWPASRAEDPVRLSPIRGPRAALRVIADSVGQISGTPRLPNNLHDVEVAWLQLGDHVGSFVQALIALGENVPMFLITKDEEEQFDRLAKRASRSNGKIIKAVWLGVPIRVTFLTTCVLARQVQRLFRGRIPAAVQTPGPAGEREWHVIDSMDRPLICRVLEGDDDELEILDRGGGRLHRETLRRSCWRLQEGWLLPPVFHNAGDAPVLPQPEPHPQFRVGR